MSGPSRNYENFLEVRKEDYNFLWVSRQLNPQLAYKQNIPRPTPRSHKHDVLNSATIQDLLEIISKRQNVSKAKLEEEVKAILDEIGYNKNLKVIRWLGLILVNICLRVSTGLYVNIDNLVQLKAEMGNCPVIFVPSHRSYADFILMSFLFFTFDIEIPAIAAGMDFHGMWGMGNVLRDTGAFFMRRSYNEDALYWATFKQYVYQIVTKGDLPIEFFMEGTRSRSNKSVMPKYGLISMILKPFFFAEVPDIKFVPINISYDRILEESLFSFELLGVPKPKESTSALLKSLKIVKEHFGKIYFHFGEPISVKNYFGDKLDRSVHNTGGPPHKQEITEHEKALIPCLAHEILRTQQKSSVITIFNLVSLILNDNLAARRQPLTIKELTDEVRWLKDVIEALGAYVCTEDIRKSIDDCFIVHNNLIEIRVDNSVGLVQNNITLDKVNSSKLKAHSLSENSMSYSVPFVMLQIYANPSLHYFVDAALIVVILKVQKSSDADNLFNAFHFLRSLFSMEFVTMLPWIKMDFQTGLQHSIAVNLVTRTPANSYELGGNEKLQDLLYALFKPFLTSYFVIISVLERSPPIIDEKSILANVQKILEVKINDTEEFVHPYSLNLDTLANGLNILVKMEVLSKTRSHNSTMYEIRKDKVEHMKKTLGNYLSDCHIEDSFTNRTYIQNKL